MKTLAWSAALVVAFVLAGGTAFAKECPNLAAVPVSGFLMPPSAEDSRETLAELAELQDLDIQRTPAQAEHARGDHERTIARFLGEIGVKVDDRPATALHFFKCIKDMTENSVDDAKRRFSRTRPYNFPNNGLHILKDVTEEDSPSYPSGHATYGMVTGLLLAEMLPERRDEIIKRIEDYGYSRMLSGVHFRSDVYSGEIAGAAIVAGLFTQKAFWDEFGPAKDDLRKALGFP
jgi:acid phosphatase (class A)